MTERDIVESLRVIKDSEIDMSDRCYYIVTEYYTDRSDSPFGSLGKNVIDDIMNIGPVGGPAYLDTDIHTNVTFVETSNGDIVCIENQYIREIGIHKINSLSNTDNSPNYICGCQ